ncbi:hypothetical protein H6P81_000793 [Aristolochia fimbriata]|uniref:t-SNARE coiled-coil homology domain-containing protein n=1 Tax=Aristolochia fimbriata TaxID=158543 RepID=A0AAV7F535_ARIFI|nr:hypothetical protein H6P81_000793 [Aristolochia fimbriata]
MSFLSNRHDSPARREYHGNRAALFDGIEEGGIRATSSYSHEIDELDNDRAMDGLQDRVTILKRLTGDIHEEVESHNRVLDRMGNDMDASRGILSGTMDRFKMVFETKSSRRMAMLVTSFVVLFLLADKLSWICSARHISSSLGSVQEGISAAVSDLFWAQQRKEFTDINGVTDGSNWKLAAQGSSSCRVEAISPRSDGARRE